MDPHLNAITDRATALVGGTVTVRLKGGGADVTGTLTGFSGASVTVSGDTVTPKTVLVITASGPKTWHVRADEIAGISN